MENQLLLGKCGFLLIKNKKIIELINSKIQSILAVIG